MSVKIECPHCKSVLSVTEQAYGKTLPCPACTEPLAVPQPDALPTLRPVRVPSPPSPETNNQGGGYPIFFESQRKQLRQVEMSAAFSSPGGARRRPAGLVCVVFWWALNGGLAIAYGVAGLAFATFLGGASQLAVRHDIAPWAGVAVAMMVELLTVLLFFGGLLLLVAAYGLWTFQRWSLPLAKLLAVGNALVGLMGIVPAMIVQAGVVLDLANLAASAAILVYLFGNRNLSERSQR